MSLTGSDVRWGRRAVSETSQPEAALGRAVIRLMERAQAISPAPLDPEVAAGLMSDEGARMLSDGDCVICTVDMGELAVAGASGRLAMLLARRRGPVAGTMAARCIAAGEAVDVADPGEDRLLGEALAAAGITTARAVPLFASTHSDQAVGAYLALGRQRRPFSQAERTSMDVYAALVALSLVRQQQQNHATALERRLAVGVDLAVHLAASLETGDVMSGLPQRAAEALEADRATLFRREGDEVVAEITYDAGRSFDPGGFRIPLAAEPLMREAAEQHRAMQGRLRVEAHPAPVRPALTSVHHSLVLPLVFGGEVLGFLNIHRRREPRFDDDAVATLHLIGNVAAVALHNARLFVDAQKARASMSEFLDVVVHELRAPLTIVSGYLSMITEGIFGEPPEAWRRPLDVVEGKLTEAQRLVDELLLAARLESGVVHSHMQRIDLAALASDAVERAQPRAELLEAALHADTSGAPVWAAADAGHVERILDNLINNALTYGGHPARITVTAVDDGAPTISVADRGTGIPESERAHIFERFFRGRESTSGYGLGLYVSRQLAENSRGSLELDTEHAGPGSRFVLRLPAVAKTT
ncbi:MAG: GAF domain-containing sensor histidine kinase [Chloroflexi bacterium]|nr:MAG: GAF domain-containing sensor histidine kinase [Chloroflexota bacterium]